MKQGYTANGLKFKIGKYKVRIWKYGWEYGDDCGGRYFFFWWAPNKPNYKDDK
jgi:hypothetical protein